MIDLCLRHRLGPVEGTMLLDISRLRTAAQDVNRQIGPEAFADLKDDFKVVGTTDGRHRGARKAPPSSWVGISVIEVTCGRQLDPFTVPVYVDVTTRFVPPADFAKVTEETAARTGRLKAETPTKTRTRRALTRMCWGSRNIATRRSTSAKWSANSYTSRCR